MSNYFIYNGRKIHYYDAGKGKTIVLLHGYLESAEIWRGLFKKLSKNFRVISVDLPGHGLSDMFEKSNSMEFIAMIVKELVDFLGIEKFFLTGHSLGGYVALAFLEFYPEQLLGYCLFHSHPFADSQEAIEKREREIKIVNAGKKDLMYPENVTRMFADKNLDDFSEELFRSRTIASRIPAEGIISVLKGMIARPSRLSFMEEGRVPCLWILGLMDNYIPCEHIQKEVNLPSNAGVEVLKKSGHLGFVEEEERTAEIIKKFVDKLNG
ncbi:MAG: alpha/beta hydrolase [Odoribacter sp.]|nr:alpha/beta hydrolase [Odoribacter sp.]